MLHTSSARCSRGAHDLAHKTVTLAELPRGMKIFTAKKKSRAATPHFEDNERFLRLRKEGSKVGLPLQGKHTCDDGCDDRANNIDPGQTFKTKKVRCPSNFSRSVLMSF